MKKFVKPIFVSVLSIYFIIGMFIMASNTIFNMKHKENSERVKDKIFEIININYSKEQYINYHTFELFNYKYSEIKLVHSKKDSEIFENREDYYHLLDENEKALSEYYNLLSLDEIIFAEDSYVTSKIPSFLPFSSVYNLMSIKILKHFDMGRNEEGKQLFNYLHHQRKKHFANANTIILKNVFYSHLFHDLELAKKIKEQYNMELDIQSLSIDDIDMELAINYEIEWMLRLTPTFSNNGFKNLISDNQIYKLNFYNEIEIQDYLDVIDYFKHFEIKKDIKYDNFEPSFIEKFVAPSEVNLLSLSLPNYFKYKEDYIKYNEGVKEYLEN